MVFDNDSFIIVFLGFIGATRRVVELEWVNVVGCKVEIDGVLGFHKGDSMAMEVFCGVNNRVDCIHGVTPTSKSDGAIAIVGSWERAGDDIEFVIDPNVEEL
jgi:hypothetical protein